MDTIKRIPTHPGDVLKEELECRKISQKKFSEVLGVNGYYTALEIYTLVASSNTIDI